MKRSHRNKVMHTQLCTNVTPKMTTIQISHFQNIAGNE